MFLRFRMNRIIRMLESDQNDDVLKLAFSDAYLKALLSLEAAGCVNLAQGRDGTVYAVFLINSYVRYILSRHEVWANRFRGFVFGVTSSVVAAFISGILHI